MPPNPPGTLPAVPDQAPPPTPSPLGRALQQPARLTVAIALIALCTLILVRGFSSLGHDDDTIILGLDIWVGFAPLHLADELGYFADEGLDVELITLKGTSEMRAALTSKRVHGVTTSLDTALRNRAVGTPARVALALDRSAGADGLVLREPLTEVGQLRGAQVALQAATPSEFLFLFLLDQAGVPLDSVQRINMDSADAGAAFVAGRVDAAVTWEPWLSQAAASEGAHLAATTGEYGHVIVDVLLLRDDLLDGDPDAVDGIRRAWYRALDAFEADPEGSIARMAPHYGVEAVVFADMVSGLEYLDEAANAELLADLDDGPAAQVVSAANRILQATGVIDRAVQPDELIHPSSVGAAP